MKTPWYKTKSGIAAISVFVLFFLVAISAQNQEKKKVETKTQTQTNQVETKQEENVTTGYVDHEIVQVDDQSYKAIGDQALSSFTVQELENLPINKKMSYKINVGSGIKEVEVTPTIKKIIEDITSQDSDIDEISLLLYSDENVDRAYDVASAIWAPDGELGNVTAQIAQANDRSEYDLDIQIKDDLEEYLTQRGKSEEKFGFTEEERKQIFKELVSAEDRSFAEADKIYPVNVLDPNYKDENVEKNMDKSTELAQKYKQEVMQKYGIDSDIVAKINIEGVMEGWSFE